MTFRVAEIRDRAVQLKAEVARERYETRAGLKERPAFRQLYEKHRFLLAPQVLPAIQRELARASGGERRRLMSLYGWVASQQVEAELAPLEDELRAWEAGTILRVGEREIPLRRAPAAMARSDARALRLEIRRMDEESCREIVEVGRSRG